MLLPAYQDFTLHAATNADIPAIKKLIFEVLREYGLKGDESGKDKDLADIQRHYFDRKGFFGVAVGSAVVGTFGIYQLDEITCELRKMYLHKDARGRGLGQHILKVSIEAAKKLRYEKMILETISPLKEAIALYRKHGFKEIAPRELSDRVDQAFALSLK